MAVELHQKKKIAFADANAIDISFEIAAVGLEPEEYSQKQVFRRLMPKIHTMRDRGFSFKQITKTLMLAGVELGLSTVRTYYYELLVEMLEECDRFAVKADKALKAAKAERKSADTTRASIALSHSVHDGAYATAKSNELVASFSASMGGALMAPKIEPAPIAATLPLNWQAPETLMVSGSSVHPVMPGEPTKSGAKALNVSKSKPNSATLDSATPMKNPPLDAGDSSASLVCLTIPDKQEIPTARTLPNEVYLEGILEHPAIVGLMLNRDQRLMQSRLEYRDASGNEQIEKGLEFESRHRWSKPIPPTQTRTSGDFVKMDTSVLGKRPSDT